MGFLDKKYLIVSGCSFTEGHRMGKSASWATHLAPLLDLEVKNLAHGGADNESIVNTLIDYSTLNKDIAKDSVYVLQLTECLRYLICLDLYDESAYHVITPNQFFKDSNNFDNWDLEDKTKKWIYDSRHQLGPIFTNITYTLIKTHHMILSFVNFCEANNYPYLMFDGINDHIPYNENGKWYLTGTVADQKYEVDMDGTSIDISELSVWHRKRGFPLMEQLLIKYLKDLKYYYNDVTLYRFVHTDGETKPLGKVNPKFTFGNHGHPNKLGAQTWAKKLNKILKDLYEEDR